VRVNSVKINDGKRRKRRCWLHSYCNRGIQQHKQAAVAVAHGGGSEGGVVVIAMKFLFSRALVDVLQVQFSLCKSEACLARVVLGLSAEHHTKGNTRVLVLPGLVQRDAASEVTFCKSAE